MTIPGIDRASARAILVELRPDIGMFASVRHCAAWAGLCLGNHQNADTAAAAGATSPYAKSSSNAPTPPPEPTTASSGATTRRSPCAATINARPLPPRWIRMLREYHINPAAGEVAARAA